jgi:hypothetical protein
LTLKAQVKTPMSKDDPTEVKIEEIPLPPPEMWSELDNTKATAVSPVPAKPPATERQIESLNFRNATTRSVVIPLVYDFDHQELGHVHSITVRRLTVGEVGDLLTARPDDAPDLFDIYEAMTAVPAPILRGLIDVDGEKVTEACWDFLPLAFRPRSQRSDVSSSSSPTGGA